MNKFIICLLFSLTAVNSMASVVCTNKGFSFVIIGPSTNGRAVLLEYESEINIKNEPFQIPLDLFSASSQPGEAHLIPFEKFSYYSFKGTDGYDKVIRLESKSLESPSTEITAEYTVLNNDDGGFVGGGVGIFNCREF